VIRRTLTERRSRRVERSASVADDVHPQERLVVEQLRRLRVVGGAGGERVDQRQRRLRARELHFGRRLAVEPHVVRRSAGRVVQGRAYRVDANRAPCSAASMSRIAT
jgi:hypothetical protein